MRAYFYAACTWDALKLKHLKQAKNRYEVRKERGKKNNFDFGSSVEL